jgi:Na+/melibiose symporter-like transporter
MEYDFILEPKDLFYHYYDRYFFLISFRDSFYFFIGKPFFKKFNIIFNQDSKQLAIYSFVQESENKEYKSMIVPTILIIIFSILVLVFVIILFRYKLKRKKLNEIEENYDYTPNLNKDTRLTEIN